MGGLFLAEAGMSLWHTTIGPDDTPSDDELGYYGGWTVSGLAVIATITAVWIFGL
jgi:hypothetical protein